MGLLEIFATVFTVLCVFLAVKRSTWQYPTGIVGTILFFFVFWGAGLYSSAWLQVVFTFVQLYGWWFWLFGDQGKKPKITSWDFNATTTIVIAGLLLGGVMSVLVAGLTNGTTIFLDSIIFGLSISAQFLLDRKKIETWFVWCAINVLSIYVYAQQELWITVALYVGLFFNTFWGYYEWRKEMERDEAEREADDAPGIPNGTVC